MKKITKLSAPVFALAAVLLVGNYTFAQDVSTTSTTQAEIVIASDSQIQDLKAKMEELKTTQTTLKAQVTAGTITVEQARGTWDKLIEELRSMKRDVFTQRIQKIETRANGLEAKDPEMAAKIREKVEALKQRRDAMHAKRDELKAGVKAGTITREQAITERKALMDSTTANVIMKRKELQEMRVGNREQKIDERKMEAKPALRDLKETLKLRDGGVRVETNSDKQ